MLTKITARHFDLTPELRARAEEELENLTRFFENIISGEFILDVERHRRIAELKLKVYKDTISAKAESDDMHIAMTQAVDKAKAQLKKYKGKLKEKKVDEISEKAQALTRPKTNVDEVDV